LDADADTATAAAAAFPSAESEWTEVDGGDWQLAAPADEGGTPIDSAVRL
jgi:hypothetical protein